MKFNDEEPSVKPPPPTLNGNDIDLWKNMGKNLACNDEEPSGPPPKKSPPTLNGNYMDLWQNMGKNLTCSDEEPSGRPPKPTPTLNGNDMDLSFTVV